MVCIDCIRQGIWGFQCTEFLRKLYHIIEGIASMGDCAVKPYVIQCRPRMAEKAVAKHAESDAESGLARVYEIGYHVAPVIKEEDVEKVVAEIRAAIEKTGGSFIAEGAPSMVRLAYGISGVEGGKRTIYDRAHFGWIKFEAPAHAAGNFDEALKGNKSILRYLVFKTVREDTRVHLKAPTLRTVTRTDTIKAAPKREEHAAPVSEVDLDKALEDITTEK